MNKSYIPALALVFAALFIFAACEKKSGYGVLFTDDKGMTHVLVTDAQGSTIQDEYRSLVEVVTDSADKKPIVIPAQTVTVTDGSGEVVSEYELAEAYQTQPITFPAFIDNEDCVEAAAYVMPKPKGWEMTGTVSIILKHTETETVLDTYVGGYADIQAGLDAIEEMRRKLTQEIPYSTEEVDICGTKGVKCHYDLGDAQRYLYLVEVDGVVYRFGVTVKTEHDGKVDYEGILNAIKFR